MTVNGHKLCFVCTDNKTKVLAASEVPVSWGLARHIEGSRRAMSSAKSWSFNISAGYLLDCRGQVTTIDSGPDVFPKR